VFANGFNFDAAREKAPLGRRGFWSERRRGGELGELPYARLTMLGLVLRSPKKPVPLQRINGTAWQSTTFIGVADWPEGRQLRLQRRIVDEGEPFE